MSTINNYQYMYYIIGYVPQARIKVDFSSDLDKKEKRNKKKVLNNIIVEGRG